MLPADSASPADVFGRFLAALGDGRLFLAAHNDADGLSAAACLTRGLESSRAVDAHVVGRFEDAWGPGYLEARTHTSPAGVILADLGVRASPVAPGRPTLVVDHHVPRGVPSDPATTVVSGYGVEPQPSTSVLAWQCLGEPGELAWIAALGAIGDFGEREAVTRFPTLMQAAGRQGSRAALRAATTLINAPRRASAGDATPALALLLRAAGPREITGGAHPETALLEAAREEVAAELARARKVAPRFAGEVALLQVRSRCQVHPLVAQTWAQRLRTSVVIAANDGYREGYVHFAARSSSDIDLVAFFARHAPVGVQGNTEFGGGHARASGGALTVPLWQALLRNLGFVGESSPDPSSR